MKFQIISQTPRSAQIVLKAPGESTTLHLRRQGDGRYTDRLGQSYDLQQPDPTPRFLAEWYGRRARVNLDYATVRAALRWAIRALPVPMPEAA